MRERLALVVIALTLVLLVGLAGVFAVRHNPGEAEAPAPPASLNVAPPAPPEPSALPASANATPAASPSVLRGAEVYREQRCATCHALAGAGNPRYPLDGVGARHDAEALRAWIVGTGAAAETLTGPVLRRKTAYRALPAEDLAALVDYLAAQR